MAGYQFHMFSGLPLSALHSDIRDVPVVFTQSELAHQEQMWHCRSYLLHTQPETFR